MKTGHKLGKVRKGIEESIPDKLYELQAWLR